MQVDLKKTDQELVQIVIARCSSLGVVKTVKVHRNPSAFTLVEMANRDQALELAGQYGGSGFGNNALIHLEQEG